LRRFGENFFSRSTLGGLFTYNKEIIGRITIGKIINVLPVFWSEFERSFDNEYHHSKMKKELHKDREECVDVEYIWKWSFLRQRLERLEFSPEN